MLRPLLHQVIHVQPVANRRFVRCIETDVHWCSILYSISWWLPIKGYNPILSRTKSRLPPSAKWYSTKNCCAKPSFTNESFNCSVYEPSGNAMLVISFPVIPCRYFLDCITSLTASSLDIEPRLL